MESEQSISSINESSSRNFANLSSMVGLGLETEGMATRCDTVDTSHNSYVKYQSSSSEENLTNHPHNQATRTNNYIFQKPSDTNLPKRSPRLHELRKMNKLSKKSSLVSSNSVLSNRNWSIPSLSIDQAKI
jgi:hypothetical protein